MKKNETTTHKESLGFLRNLEALSIWKPASVQQEPETRLTQWRVFLVDSVDGTRKDTHFVGWAGYEGRVCSAVKSFDAETRRGITRSGRVYELVGPSGINGDAMYTWGRWADINGITNALDVTDQYEKDKL